MKMVQAVVRPEKEAAVASALAGASLPALTKWDVVGRGKQQGVQVGGQIYDELAKTTLMIVVEDDRLDEVVDIIRKTALHGYPGDGKVFVTDVERAVTVRTGKAEL